MANRAALPEPAAVLPGEADILARVASDPSDDTAKLVYADWLEDRDDPRGPFLRAFVAALRSGAELPAGDFPRPWLDLVGWTIVRLAREHGFADRAADLLEVARPAIRITPARRPSTKPPFARSRYGGLPDLPPNVEWPHWTNGKLLSFLGQIDLADLTGSAIARDLPPAGLLAAFYYLNENDGDLYGGPRRDDDGNATGAEGWRLFHFPPDAFLAPRPLPDALAWSRFQPHPLVFDERLELPDDRNGWFEASELEGTEWDRYWDLLCAVNAADEYGDRLLGHSQCEEWASRFGRTGHTLWSVGLTGERPELWGDFLTRVHVLVAGDDLRAGRFDRVRLESQWLST